jgi:hypothetical protein
MDLLHKEGTVGIERTLFAKKKDTPDFFGLCRAGWLR